MWIVLGVLSVLAAVLNLLPIKKIRKKTDPKLLVYISLAMLALCLCSYNNITAEWITHERWTDLAEKIPDRSQWLWLFSVMMVTLNSIPFIRERWK